MLDWREYQGELVDGTYPLEQYLGGDETSSVFLTPFGGGKAAIRIRRGDEAEAARLVQGWNRVKLLRHPHLLEIHAVGTAAPAGAPAAYVVMERAEENLGEILNERPLTADETREVLLQACDALAYLHSQGMTHGDLKASNILAIGNTIKLSSETIGPGDPATDIQALGCVVIHALTQLPVTLTDVALEAAADLPSPFDEVARGCLDPDPVRRWSATQILGSLGAREQTVADAVTPPPAARPTSRPGLRRLVGAAGVAAVGAALVVGFVMYRTDGPSPGTGEPRRTPAVATPGAESAAPLRPSRQEPSTGDATEDGVTRRVLPDIPARARKTIRGNPEVVVRVTVDPAGNVTKAVLRRSFSRYFGKLALEAARQWQFVPAGDAGRREWILGFEFTKSNTRVAARRAGRN